MLGQTLHDLEDVLERLVGLGLPTLHVHLEERDGAGEIGCDSVMEVARDSRPLASHGVFDRLVRKTLIARRDLFSRLLHRAAARRLANDSNSAIISGCRSKRKTRRYGFHSRLVSSIAAGSFSG